MAWNDNEGLVDLFNGKHDICNKVLRFVGNTEECIKEDPLRMLLAVRFIKLDLHWMRSPLILYRITVI